METTFDISSLQATSQGDVSETSQRPGKHQQGRRMSNVTALPNSGGHDYRIVTLKEFLDDPTIKPRRELLGPWLAQRGLVLLYAPTGIGKSWFAAGVAAAVASGGSFGGYTADRPSRVLYIDGEMDPSDLQSRFGMIAGASEGTDAELVAENVSLFARHHQPPSVKFPNFGDPGDRRAILDLIRQQRPHLVVLDNLSTLSSVADENAAQAWDPVLELLQDIKPLGSAVLVVHHSNKAGGSYRGSSKIAVLFDTIMSLKEDPEAAGVNGAAFLWTFEKARKLGVDVHKGVAGRLEDGRWHWDTRYDAELAKLAALVRSRTFKTQGELAEHIGVSKGEISKRLRDADTAGILSKEDRDRCFQIAKDEEEQMREGEPGSEPQF
jgi:hypothetical protein